MDGESQPKKKPHSTLAISVYNVLSLGGACSLNEIKARLATHAIAAPIEDIDLALGEMTKRGYVEQDVGGDWAVRAKPGYVVAKRDRTDPTGWSGWKFVNKREVAGYDFEEIAT